MCVPVSAQHKLSSAVSKATLLADFTRECCRSSDLFVLAESLFPQGLLRHHSRALVCLPLTSTVDLMPFETLMIKPGASGVLCTL